MLVVAYDFENQLQDGLVNGTLGYLIKHVEGGVLVQRYDNQVEAIWRYAQPVTIELCKKERLI